jgi:glycosyltransferase involved in cell wall biosynthesis
LSSAEISIVYITYRQRPQFDWFADGLASQLGDDVPELVLVDGLHSPERAREMEAIVAGRLPFRHVAAKPNPVNGPDRLTRGEYRAASSARNTGVVHSSGPYVVFADDLAVPMPGWWEEVRRAAEEDYVVAGAYQKHHEMRVRNGLLLSSSSNGSGIDSRWARGSESHPVRIDGGNVYGCSFGVPRDLLLEVNGQDEICNVVGGEDYQLGLRLEWAGAPILYSRRMLTIESEEGHAREPAVRRIDRALDERAYMAKLAEFGVTRRHTEGNFDNSNMILDILYGTRTTESIGNYYDLAELTEADLPDTIERFPSRHWFDGREYREM